MYNYVTSVDSYTSAKIIKVKILLGFIPLSYILKANIESFKPEHLFGSLYNTYKVSSEF